MKKHYRIFSLMMAAVLVLGLLPSYMPAYAETTASASMESSMADAAATEALTTETSTEESAGSEVSEVGEKSTGTAEDETGEETAATQEKTEAGKETAAAEEAGAEDESEEAAKPAEESEKTSEKTAADNTAAAAADNKNAKETATEGTADAGVKAAEEQPAAEKAAEDTATEEKAAAAEQPAAETESAEAEKAAAEEPAAAETAPEEKAAETETIQLEAANAAVSQTADIPVKVVWSEAGSTAQIPASVKVRIHADGQEAGSLELSASGDGGWNGTFTGIRTKKDDGGSVTLSVSEDHVDGWQWIVTGTAEEGFVVTNYALRSIAVEKQWVYEGGVEGAKPESVTVRLYADGAEVDSAELKADAENADQDWKCVFEGLDRVHEDGSEIVYSVTEDGTAGYLSAVTGDADNGFTVTNTGSFLNISVSKEWNDAEDKYKKRPESVTVKLLADGKEAASAELKADAENADQDWKYIFEGFPKYREPEDTQTGTAGEDTAREEIEYTIEEAAVEGYQYTVEGSAAEGFVLTNTLDLGLGGTMQVVSVNGTAVEPCTTYAAMPGDRVTLEGELTLPALTGNKDFAQAVFVGCLDPASLEIELTDADGNPVELGVLPEGYSIENPPQGIFRYVYQRKNYSFTITTGNSIVFMGPGSDIVYRFRVTGTAVDMEEQSIGSIEGQNWFELWLTKGTGGNIKGESQQADMTACCFLGMPSAIFRVFDENHTPVTTVRCSYTAMDESYMMAYLLSGATSFWARRMTADMPRAIAEAKAGNPAFTELLKPYLEMEKNIEGFTLSDSSGTQIGYCPLPTATAFRFPGAGTYTLDVKQRADADPDFHFDPIEIEVTLADPNSAQIGMQMYEAYGMEKYHQLRNLLNSGSVMEIAARTGYEFTVNGEKVPLLSMQELMNDYVSLQLNDTLSYDSLWSNSSYDDYDLPVHCAASASSVIPIIVPAADDEPVSHDGAVVMKILQDGKTAEAVTAAYDDPFTWQSKVDVSNTEKPFDWVIELRYDVNNQDYPTGSGVNPLFERNGDPVVKLVFRDGTEMPLTPGVHYTLESPEGYFRIDEGYQDENGRKVQPSALNGLWYLKWYESDRYGRYHGQSGAAYFLHPYFQKQVITFTQNDAAAQLLAAHPEGVKYIVVECEGKLSEYAYAGGCGNPARVLAFAGTTTIKGGGQVGPPIYKGPRLMSLQPDPDASKAPNYYFNTNYYENIGFDTTSVYTSSVTVHKVDEKKKDLKGAEFTLTPKEDSDISGARVIQGKSSHLVLSHFIPGFAMIRPVPDTVEDVSRRNLTSIGQPAQAAADPQGDATGSEAYLTYAGLREGSYIVRETKAPAGYRKADDMEITLHAELPVRVETGYEFCRWTATVNGEEVPIVDQLAEEYPEVDNDAYQMFSCNSSCIILRVVDEPNDVTVEKVWSDRDNAEKVRPASVEVQLYSQDPEDKTGTKTAVGSPVRLSSRNGWKYTWTGLDCELTWTVEEVSVPAGYRAEISGSSEEGFTITNEYVFDSVVVQKKWAGRGDAGKRPDGIWVQLYRQNKNPDGTAAGGKEAYGRKVWLNGDNQWYHQWSRLDTVNYIWTVDELYVPDGYKKTVTGDQQAGFVITNTYETPGINIPVEKVWKGGEADSVLIQLYRQSTAGTAPEDTGLFLELNKANSWKGEFKDLPAEDADGQPYTYSVKENTVKGYSTEITGDQKTGFTVTNTKEPEPETVEIHVIKRWKGKEAPEAVVRLMRSTAAGSPEDTGEKLVLNAGNSWQGSFKDLPKTDADGKAYVYSIREDAIEGYTVEITGDAEAGFIVVNTAEEAEPGRRDIPVEKFWDGAAAGPVTVYLYRQTDGAADAQKEDTGRFLQLTAEKGWKDTFYDLPVEDAEGRLYVYTVEEEPVSGYTTKVTGDMENGFTVTNTQTPPEPPTPPTPPTPDQPTPPTPPTPFVPFTPGTPPAVTPPVPVQPGVLGAVRGVLGAARGVLGATRTGDDRFMWLWFAVMAVGTAMLAGYGVMAKRRKAAGKKTGD